MRIIISAVIIFCIEFSFGQGMKFDQDSFVSTPKIDQTRSAVYSSYSLERYAPTPYPQSGGTCVAHAFTNARTILLAKELRTTNAEDIALLMFSPYHFYYENKNVTDYDCSDGLDLDKAAKYALNYGFCPLVNVEYKYYYPFSDHELCPTAKYPTNLVSNRSTSMKYRPDNLYRIENISDIRIALSNDMPIVVGMAVPNSFASCTSKTWDPRSTDNIESSYGHAMLIVGYDDNFQGGSVRVMNSWGTSWGDAGFVWIRYKDLGNWTYGGYAIEKYYRSRGAAEEKGFNDEALFSYLQDSDSLESEDVQNNEINNYIITQLTDSSYQSSIIDVTEGDKKIDIITSENLPIRNHYNGPFRRAYGLKD